MTIKQHDTAPAVSITCTGDAGPVDLTTATQVKIIGSLEGLVLFADVTTGTDEGVVTRAWFPGDVDTAGDTATSGTILVEVEVTWPDGTVETFPADGYLTVEVLPDLG